MRAEKQAGLLSKGQLHALGFSHEQLYYRLREGTWLRVTRGVYNVLPNHPWQDPFSAARRQSAWTGLLAVPRGISTGACALALHGVWGLPQWITPEVALPGGASSRGPGHVKVRRYAEFAVRRVLDRQFAAPVDALVQALPGFTRDTAVCVLDSAVHRRLIHQRDLQVIAERLAGRRGASRVYPWLGLVNPLAQSPFETLTRLQCLDADLPPPTLQAAVWDEGNHRVARGDLGWKRRDGTWVLIDLDGRRYHEGLDALLVDRRRQNAIALTHRHTHLRFAWEDLYTGIIPATIARALQAPGEERPGLNRESPRTQPPRRQPR